MAEQRKSTCCWCCKRGTVSLRCVLERSAYVCKECIRLKATVDNQGEDEVQIKYFYRIKTLELHSYNYSLMFTFRVRLEQVCEFFIDRGVLGVSKDLKRLVFEYR